MGIVERSHELPFEWRPIALHSTAPGLVRILPPVEQASREHASTSHSGNDRLPVLPHADTGTYRLGAGPVKVPSSTAHCFACMALLLATISKAAGGAARIAAGMLLAYQSPLAASLATVLLGATTARALVLVQ